MLWTWVLVCLIAGELSIYLILTAAKALLPYRVAPPIRSMIMFYVLCLGLFVMGGISFFSYNDTQQRLQDLDVLYDQVVDVIEVGDTIMLMESSQRSYLLTGNQSFLDTYGNIKKTIDQKLEATRKAYKGSPDQSRVDVFSELVKSKILLLDKNIEIKRTGRPEDVGIPEESKKIMSMILVTGKDLQDRRLTEYKRIMSGFRSLGSVRVYMSFTLMVAALVQIGIAAILGRSRRPISSSGLVSGETFFP